MEHKLVAYQCSECKIEFVLVILNEDQWKSGDDDPYCPKCGQDDPVNPIDCVDIRLFERVQQYEVTKAVKPLPQ